MTTLLEQAVGEGWTVGAPQQLKNVQMCPIQYKGRQALIQLLPRGNMSIKVPFAPSVYRGTGQETRLNITFDTPASVIAQMQQVEDGIVAKAREILPNLDALWCSCIKPTPYGPQLRCKVNTEGPHKIQMISETGEALTVEDLNRRPVLPILAIRGIYVQRNQVGLMVDVVACIVGEKPKYEVPPIDFL